MKKALLGKERNWKITISLEGGWRSSATAEMSDKTFKSDDLGAQASYSSNSEHPLLNRKPYSAPVDKEFSSESTGRTGDQNRIRRKPR